MLAAYTVKKDTTARVESSGGQIKISFDEWDMPNTWISNSIPDWSNKDML